MTTEQTREQNINPMRPGMLDTIIQLGTATTNLALDQMGNAFTALTHPGAAIEHVKDTLLNLSDAMNNSASGRTGDRPVSEPLPASDLRGASDGMEYLVADVPVEHARSPFVDVTPKHASPMARTRVVKKINHRKA